MWERLQELQSLIQLIKTHEVILFSSVCFSSLVTKKGCCLHTFSIILLLWDRTVFGQLPAWHHPLPALFSGCWPAPLQVYSNHSNKDGGGAQAGWLQGWCLLCNMLWSGDWRPSLQPCSLFFLKPCFPFKSFSLGSAGFGLFLSVLFTVTEQSLFHWSFGSSHLDPVAMNP